VWSPSLPEREEARLEESAGCGMKMAEIEWIDSTSWSGWRDATEAE
jgi:hypothetical protein